MEISKQDQAYYLKWGFVGAFVTTLILFLCISAFYPAHAQEPTIDEEKFYELQPNGQGKFFEPRFEKNQVGYQLIVNFGDPAHPAEIILPRDKVTFITPESPDGVLPAINFSLKNGEISNAIVVSDTNRLVFEGIFPAEMLDENQK